MRRALLVVCSMVLDVNGLIVLLLAAVRLRCLLFVAFCVFCGDV